MEYENQILEGKCLNILRDLPDETFDAVVTDPPYGLGKEPTVGQLVSFLKGADLVTGDFMGAQWEIPSVPVWREVYRVLKPGGHVLSFGGTRSWDLISLGARAAGFEFRDTIAGVYPALMMVHGMGFPKSLNVSKEIDKRVGAEREVVGTYRVGGNALTPASEKGGTYVTGAPNSPPGDLEITAPATEDAKKWEGYGTALKPSFEPVVVFRKPFTFRDIVRTMGSHIWSLHAKLVELRSASSHQGSSEGSGSVPQPVGQRSVTPVVSPEAMAILLSDKAIVSSLNIASSWLNTLEGLLQHESMFTTEMVSSLTTDLKTLSYFLWGITPEGMPGALSNDVGLPYPAEFVARMFDAVAMKLSAILVSSVGEDATELGRRKRREETARGCSPTWEPILVFRKPLDGTVVENVLEHGTGALNIDGCRVGSETREYALKAPAENLNVLARPGKGDDPDAKGLGAYGVGAKQGRGETVAVSGRWPPNMTLSHAPGCRRVGSNEKGTGALFATPDGMGEVDVWECSDGCPVKALNEQSGELKSGRLDRSKIAAENKVYGVAPHERSGVYEQDSGTASRFFPQFPGQEPPDAPFFYTSKATKKEATLEGRIENRHPTKKPLGLMQWLVRLVCPKEGIILDPYCGSGTTLHAAAIEGMRWTGIERDSEWIKTAWARMEIISQEVAEDRAQRDTFDLMGDLMDEFGDDD